MIKHYVINQPNGATLLLIYKRPISGVISIYDGKGNILYWREVNPTRKVQVNLPNISGDILIKSHVIPDSIVELPLRKLRLWIPDEKDKIRPYQFKDIKVYRNFDMHTPARIHNTIPRLEINPAILSKFPQQWQRFIFWHEMGHFWTNDEEEADEIGMRLFLHEGNNFSQGVNAQTKVLGRSKENVMRMVKQNEFVKKLDRQNYDH